MLLGLTFCLLAVRFGGRLGEWTWRQGLVLGLVAGALSMVREQSRFGVLAVLALLVGVAVARPWLATPVVGHLSLGALLLLSVHLLPGLQAAA